MSVTKFDFFSILLKFILVLKVVSLQQNLCISCQSRHRRSASTGCLTAILRIRFHSIVLFLLCFLPRSPYFRYCPTRSRCCELFDKLIILFYWRQHQVLVSLARSLCISELFSCFCKFCMPTSFRSLLLLCFLSIPLLPSVFLFVQLNHFCVDTAFEGFHGFSF